MVLSAIAVFTHYTAKFGSLPSEQTWTVGACSVLTLTLAIIACLVAYVGWQAELKHPQCLDCTPHLAQAIGREKAVCLKCLRVRDTPNVGYLGRSTPVRTNSRYTNGVADNHTAIGDETAGHYEHEPACPKCGSTRVVTGRGDTEWACRICGKIFYATA